MSGTINLFVSRNNTRGLSAGLIRSATDATPARFPELVVGDDMAFSLKVVSDTSDGTLETLTGYSIRLGIGTPGAQPSGGTFTITDGTDTTSALTFDESAADIQTALNALNTSTGPFGDTVTVTGAAGGPWKITFDSTGSKSSLSVTTSSLTPDSGGVVSELVAGDGSTQEVQAIQIYQQPLVLVTSWTISGTSATASADLNDYDLYQQVASSTDGVLSTYLEIEITDSSGNIATLVQKPITVRAELLPNGAGAQSLNFADYALLSHTHSASDITTGTLAHERGGLEADVSAYSGLVKISGGSTSAVAISTGGERLVNVTANTNLIPYFTSNNAASTLSFLDEDDMASDSAAGLPSQQSVKAYVDGAVANVNGSGTLNASNLTSGVLAHERGGLEADVSAYDGIVKISGGATSAVTVSTGGTRLLNVTANTNLIPYFTSNNAASTLSLLDEDDMASDSTAGVPTQQSAKAYVDASVANVTQMWGFALTDETTNATTGEKIAFDAPINFTLHRVYVSCGGAPTGSALTVDVEDEGASVLNSVVSVSASANNGEANAFTGGSSHAFTKGDLVSIDIDSVGSTNNGTGVKAFFEVTL